MAQTSIHYPQNHDANQPRQTLTTRASYTFNVDWWYNINNRMEIGGRSGYEYFERTTTIYTHSQFFPRMCVTMTQKVGRINNSRKWRIHLPFGDYDVKIAVPTDHVVAATGNLVTQRNFKRRTNQTTRISKKAKKSLFSL